MCVCVCVCVVFIYFTLLITFKNIYIFFLFFYYYYYFFFFFLFLFFFFFNALNPVAYRQHMTGYLNTWATAVLQINNNNSMFVDRNRGWEVSKRE